MIVLDASALLALLYAESGYEAVEGVFDEACISSVNVCEVLSRFARDGHDPQQLLLRLQNSPIDIVAFTAEHAALAAEFVEVTRRVGLSLGDRACLGLARHRRVAAMTADRAWATLDLDIEIRLIR